MIKTQLGAQRYNNRMTRIMEDARQLERERLQRGEMPRVPEPMATEKLGSVYSASTTLGELFREQVERAGLNSFPTGTVVTRSIEITKDEAINGIR
jgi:hypothetical protein